jgi:MFS family permease
MTEDRERKLEKNFFKIFFINALLNVKMINIVLSLFYIYRSLAVADIFYLGMVYSAAVILSEIPSSYLADKFGRKRTVILATFFGLFHWVFFLVADGFLLFAIGSICYAFAESLMSGTDEAIVYDTNKELGLDSNNSSLKKLSRYLYSERTFKVVSAFLGALIAKDLASWQFDLIIIVDIVASLFAMFFAFTLIEPSHFTDLEEQEAGLIKNAFTILSHDKKLSSAVFNKSLVFTASQITWFYMGVLFIEHLGVSAITMGIMWSLYHLLVIICSHYLHLWLALKSEAYKIDLLNFLFLLSLVGSVVSWFLFPQKYIVLLFYLLGQFFSAIAQPFFSNMFNESFRSYNRATALSLSNFARYVIVIPLLPIVGFLVNFNLIFPYIISLVLVVVVMLYFRLSKYKYEPKII